MRRTRQEVERFVYRAEIMTMLGWSDYKYRKYSRELKDLGILFHHRTVEHRLPVMRVAAYPSDLRAWVRMKAKRREPI